MKALKGKVALVTGGSRGIGRAIALALAEEGADIAVNYVSHSEAAEEVCNTARKFGVRVGSYKADVSKADQVDAMIAAILQDFGQPIQILVNDAGITRDKSFVKMSRERSEEHTS